MNNKFIENINDNLNNQQEVLELKSLAGHHNIVFIIDMLNGFCKKGNLASPEIAKIINPIANLTKKAIQNKIKIIAFNDNHNEFSPEFESYPQHCLEDSIESQLVSELNFPEVKIIKKNSTNGFFAFDFKPNLQWDNIIVVGCCTDICIYQFALSSKAWFNQHNKPVNIFVPTAMTTTFDNEQHPSEIINQIAWHSMLTNGIKIVKDIK